MAHSSLNLERYGTPVPNYFQHSSDLFNDNNDKNSIIETEETLSKLLNDFKRLYEQTQIIENGLYDTILEIDYKINNSKVEKIYAQRQLLICRSLYFEKAFTNKESTDDFNFTTEQNGIVTIKFKDEFSTDLELGLLQEIVEYMYWGFWEKRSLARTKQIFQVSSLLDLKNLRDISSEELSSNLTIQNAAEFLVMAERCEARVFKKSCLQYIINHRKELEVTNFENVLLKNTQFGPRLIDEIYKEDVYSKRGSSS